MLESICFPKYSRAVRRRVSRELPLSGLRPKPKETPPLERTLRDGPQVPLECFTNALGLNIIVYSWPATTKRPKAIILMAHGLDGFAESDLAKRPGLADGKGFRGSWLEALTRAGYLIYSFDMQGMGFSESVVDGMRSMCFDYEDYVDDALQLRHLLSERHPGLPMIMLGGSMGGCVSLLAAERMPSAFAAVVVMAPAVGHFEKLKAKPSNMLTLPLLGCLSACVPHVPVGAKHINPDSAAVAEEFLLGLPRYNQPARMRARYCAEGLRAGELAIAQAHKLTMPLYIIHARDDEMTDYAGSEALMAAAASKNKVLINDLEGADHQIVEADANRYGLKYVQQLIKWLDQIH
ncbi:hypothetical protein AB1Y20_000617 [Prymnesium parvum]|uniref:Serine aminopeptidase S33 domain-containing protein n=1 Tax=Prymnesium parvum TaxID=97485 RepID=A0AB34K8M8_PRYPA